MKVSLPPAWEQFIVTQVKSGEFENPSEVVREGLRLLRDEREAKAMAEMRDAFAGVDAHAPKGEPAAKDRALIDQLIHRHRRKRNGA